MIYNKKCIYLTCIWDYAASLYVTDDYLKTKKNEPCYLEE